MAWSHGVSVGGNDGLYKVHGLEEVLKSMEQFTDEIKEKMVRSEMWKASEAIRDEAIRLAPEDEGRLKEFIGRISKKSPDGMQAIVKIGLVELNKSHIKRGLSSDAYYGMFVELGTEHQPAQPFLRPAFDGKKEEYLARLTEGLRLQVERARKRAAKR